MAPHLILFLAANPSNTSRLALDQECAAIELELRMATNRDDFEFRSKWAVTVDELMRHLIEWQPTVIHFSGHGVGSERLLASSPAASRDIVVPDDFDEGSSGICLQDEQGKSQLITARALTMMIKSAAASSRVVVLNACYSELQANAVCSVVDCVVGMTGAIGDDAARSFAVGFYRALGNGRSVGNAVEHAVATLAAKQLPDEHLPRCRTRTGIDANYVILSGGTKVANVPLPGGPEVSKHRWEQRFEAVIRLSREAHEKLESDPLSAALRARQAIEHIADYLHERELGPAEWSDKLDAKLKRVEAKFVLPPMVANHFGSVQIHTHSVIYVGGMVADPEPSLLRPCLGSLAIVVEWFFREYLKQPSRKLGWGSVEWPLSDKPLAPDATPLNSTMGTMLNTATRFGTGIGELIPIWRTTPMVSTLRIEAPDGDAPDQRVFRVEDPGRTYLIGRTEQRSDGTRNDFALPKAWSSISRDQGMVVTQEGGVLLTNTSSKDNVFVRGEVVARGATRSLRQGDAIQLGRCVGTFSDGRYYAATPAAAVDRRTGLLSRLGLIAEISGVLATGNHRVLFVLRCPDDVMNATSSAVPADPERLAAIAAMAIHRHDPSSPVARIGMAVAALLASENAVDAVAAVVDRLVGTRCVSGFVTLKGTADQAMPRLEACLGALSRIAIAGRELAGPEDLTRYALTPTPLDAFAVHARPLFELGGGAILFALGDLEQLKRLVPQAVPVLELELVEMLGARMGPRDLVSFAGPGLLLFGTAGDVERFAQEVGVAWHARGPVTANTFEIDRCLSAHLLASSDLDDVAERAATLARGENCALGASGLPAPLALAASAIDETQDPVERARALVRLAELTWKLLAFVLVALHAQRQGSLQIGWQ